MAGITHIFFAAYIEKETSAASVPPNAVLLRSLIDTVEPLSPDLRCVNLLQGSNWYGNHLSPYQTPAREDDPRHMPPSFYHDQKEMVAARAAKKSWTWSAASPHGICGYAVGNPMNLGMLISVFATVSKALGLPLRHRGSAANANALYQVTDTKHQAKSVVWMSTTDTCGAKPFNITNGDIF